MRSEYLDEGHHRLRDAIRLPLLVCGCILCPISISYQVEAKRYKSDFKPPEDHGSYMSDRGFGALNVTETPRMLPFILTAILVTALTAVIPGLEVVTAVLGILTAIMVIVWAFIKTEE
jgi:hypothetical protein